VVFSVDAPTFVDAPNLSLRQAGRVMWFRFSGVPVAVNSGDVVACTSNLNSAEATLALADPVGRAMCVDEQHLQQATGEVVSCSVDERCAVALGSDASCRALADVPCDPLGDTCVGLCEQHPDNSASCVDEQANDDLWRCDGLRFVGQRGFEPTIAYATMCAERCEHWLGCIASAGNACGEFTRCIDPDDDVTLLDCPDTGVCPE
jgi:hypothetical protein